MSYILFFTYKSCKICNKKIIIQNDNLQKFVRYHNCWACVLHFKMIPLRKKLRYLDEGLQQWLEFLQEPKNKEAAWRALGWELEKFACDKDYFSPESKMMNMSYELLLISLPSDIVQQKICMNCPRRSSCPAFKTKFAMPLCPKITRWDVLRELKEKLDIFVHVTQIPSEFTNEKVTIGQP